MTAQLVAMTAKLLLWQRSSYYDSAVGCYDSTVGCYYSAVGCYYSAVGWYDSEVGYYDSEVGCCDSEMDSPDAEVGCYEPELSISSRHATFLEHQATGSVRRKSTKSSELYSGIPDAGKQC